MCPQAGNYDGTVGVSGSVYVRRPVAMTVLLVLSGNAGVRRSVAMMVLLG